MQRPLGSSPRAYRLPLYPTNRNLCHHAASSYHSPYPHPPRHAPMDHPYTSPTPNYHYQTIGPRCGDTVPDLAFKTRQSIQSYLMEICSCTPDMYCSNWAQVHRHISPGTQKLTRIHPQALCIPSGGITCCKCCREEEARCARGALHVYTVRKSTEMGWLGLDHFIVCV